MNNDIGNTLLKHCGEEPMPYQPLAMVLGGATKQIINDALKPGPEIDATTREMAGQAEIAYQLLSEALSLTPEQMCHLSLSDLAATAAARLEDQPPPADAVFLAKANRALGEQLEALEEANQALGRRVSHLSNEVRERDQTIAGLQRLMDQIHHSLDLSPAASSMDILAEIENLSRLADRAIQIGARDAVSGPYVVITTVHSGAINDITLAREKAELVAKRSTEGSAAVAQIIASVELAPKWSDSAQIGRHE